MSKDEHAIGFVQSWTALMLAVATALNDPERPDYGATNHWVRSEISIAIESADGEEWPSVRRGDAAAGRRLVVVLTIDNRERARTTPGAVIMEHGGILLELGIKRVRVINLDEAEDIGRIGP